MFDLLELICQGKGAGMEVFALRPGLSSLLWTRAESCGEGRAVETGWKAHSLHAGAGEAV